MKVLIAGAGAIGQWLGAKLQTAGHNVTLLTTPRHVEPLRALKISGQLIWSGSLSATSDVAELPRDFEAIILTCKANLTQSLAPKIAPLLGREGPFISLQNGLGNAQKIGHFVSPERIVVALTSHGIMLEAPGRLHHAGIGGTQVGPFVPAGEPLARRATHLLGEAGLSPEFHADIRGFIWRKALINHAVNGLAALHGVPNGEVLVQPKLHAAALQLLHEGLAVATKARVSLPAGDLPQLLDATLQRTSSNRVSMLQDVTAHRATEIEQLTGRLIRLGERLGVAMPASRTVYTQLKALEASYLAAAAGEGRGDEAPWESDSF